MATKKQSKKSNKSVKNIDVQLEKLCQTRTDLIRQIKRLEVKIFKTETEQLTLGKDGPLTKTIENYTIYRKELINQQVNDGDRIFSGELPKMAKRET